MDTAVSAEPGKKQRTISAAKKALGPTVGPGAFLVIKFFRNLEKCWRFFWNQLRTPKPFIGFYKTIIF